MADTSAKGLYPRIKRLLNNIDFSDVEFIFDDKTKLFGHKLILALRSEYFASRYENQEIPMLIELPATEKKYIFHMLKFIYTDSIELNSLEEAKDLLSVAKKFGVEELVTECVAFLLKDQINLSTILFKYEIAFHKNIESLVTVCKSFICDNAEKIFKDDNMKCVSLDVLLDIVKIENLSISSEMVILEAVMNWGIKKCESKENISSQSTLRELIFPFLKHIRFLTLTDDEFQSVVEKYKIFNDNEIALLMRKILKPQASGAIPEHICSIDFKRGSQDSRKSKNLPVINRDLNSGLNSTPREPTSSSNGLFHQNTKSSYLNTTARSALDQKKNSLVSSSAMSPLDFQKNGFYMPTSQLASDKNDLSNLKTMSSVPAPILEPQKSNDFDLKTISAAYNLPYAPSKPQAKQPLHHKSKLLDQELALKKSDDTDKRSLFGESSKDSERRPLSQKDRLSMFENFSNMGFERTVSNILTTTSKMKNSPETVHQLNPKETFGDSKKITFEIKKQHSVSESTSGQNRENILRQYSATESKTAVERHGIFQRLQSFTMSNIKPSVKCSDLRTPTMSRTFDLPLHDIRPRLDLSFEKDVKCSIDFTMKAGALKILGFEMFIQNNLKNTSEKLKFDIDFEGFSKHTYNKCPELKENMIQVMFKEPVVLLEKKGELSVSVDGLFPYRCRFSNTKQLEIKSGPYWICELTLKSNFKVESDGILFLINKLFYSA